MFLYNRNDKGSVRYGRRRTERSHSRQQRKHSYLCNLCNLRCSKRRPVQCSWASADASSRMHGLCATCGVVS
ncbi:hypothetical protein LINPERHAP2_LOCUS5550 [Linum perenne]